MPSVGCQIVRWVADKPQPGWVEVSLVDASGREWLFFDKPPIFSDQALGPGSRLVAGAMRCRVLSEQGKLLEVELLDTESEDGTTRFLVWADQLEGG
jgi:hypothetical protein